VWQLKGIRRNTDKGRCLLCFGKEMINTYCWTVSKMEIGEWLFLNEKWLNTEKRGGLRGNIKVL